MDNRFLRDGHVRQPGQSEQANRSTDALSSAERLKWTLKGEEEPACTVAHL
jgi:hypothetical protein